MSSNYSVFSVHLEVKLSLKLSFPEKEIPSRQQRFFFLNQFFLVVQFSWQIQQKTKKTPGQVVPALLPAKECRVYSVIDALLFFSHFCRCAFLTVNG